MSDNKEKVKLIIEIPKNYLETIKHTVRSTAENGNTPLVFEIIANGIPLDDVKVEIKAMFPPSGDWMYGEEHEHEHTVCEVLSDVLQILDNIGKEEKEGINDRTISDRKM